MQDFAKNRTVAARDSVELVGEWKIDAGSVLFGVLLGAMIVIAGFKAADHRETQEYSGEPIGHDTNDATGITFEFYTELKRNDLYPVMLH